MSDQLDLDFIRTEPAQLELFRGLLAKHGWLTRKELCAQTGWSERIVRKVAEQLGAEVVRGQRGFKLTSQIEREEIGVMQQASDAAISQGKAMIRYGVALRRVLHSLVG